MEIKLEGNEEQIAKIKAGHNEELEAIEVKINKLQEQIKGL